MYIESQSIPSSFNDEHTDNVGTAQKESIAQREQGTSGNGILQKNESVNTDYRKGVWILKTDATNATSEGRAEPASKTEPFLYK